MKFVQFITMSIHYADNILFDIICHNVNISLCRQYIICYHLSQCQYIIMPTIYYDAANVNVALWKAATRNDSTPQYQTRKDKYSKKSRKYIFQLHESLNALLKASWSKFVFDFDLEKLNIPSNFYSFTKEKHRVKWKIKT